MSSDNNIAYTSEEAVQIEIDQGNCFESSLDNDDNIQINDLQQALALKTHFEFLKKRVEVLENDWMVAHTESEQLDAEIQFFVDKNLAQTDDVATKRQQVQIRYERTKDELDKQIELLKEILAQKVEAHKALVKFLKTIDFKEELPDELSKFNSWSIFKRSNNRTVKNKALADKLDKAKILGQLNAKCRTQLNSFHNMANTTNQIQNMIGEKLRELKNIHSTWSETEKKQILSLHKMSKNTDQLNNIIIQCAGSENISEPMTKYVRQKCIDFLASSSTEDLLNGILKYKQRLNKIVHSMKLQETIITREVNQLTVIKDQTSDQTRFYSEIVANKRKKLTYESFKD